MKKIIIKENKFFNDSGLEITPKGVNMVCKDKSRHYIGDYKSEDFTYLKNLGMNLVRLGIFWDGVEPVPGKYDEDYLKKIDDIIRMAAQNDICVFLDMHQDLFSAEFEDGAPGWATITDGNEYFKTELWSDAYLMCPAVQIAFDSFWQNKPAPDGIGLQDHYATMWKMLAKRYASNPYVIGYDILNEPFPGSAANKVMETLLGTIATMLPPGTDVMEGLSNPQKKTELFEKIGSGENLIKLVSAIEPVTGNFEETDLNSFYKKIFTSIRQVDKETFLMLENNYFSNAGIPSHVRPVKDDEGRVVYGQVFAPHGYDIFVDTDMYETTDFTRIDMIFETHRQVAAAMNIPVIIGEWGCFPEASESQMEQAKHLLSIFKKMKAGNTYYEFAHIRNPALEKVLKD